MKPSYPFRLLLAVFSLLVSTALAQSPTSRPSLSPEQILEKARPSVALVLSGRSANGLDSGATAIVVRENGILLTALHVIDEASVVQVFFDNGETFDNIQVL
jgi:S1-C subfamily serine protease